jgi:hypothetical protein
MKGLWKDLADADAAKAYQAMWELSDASRTAAAFLIAQVAPVKSADRARVEKAIADLDSDEFPTREAASKALAEIGEPALPFLTNALQGTLSLETRRRLEQFVTMLTREPGLDELRPLRAVQALELAGTPEARAALRAWANGAAGARLTEAARAALARLADGDISRAKGQK